MFRRIDFIAISTALLLHAGIAIGMLSVHQRPPKKTTVVDVELTKPKAAEPAKITQPEPPPPEPEKKVIPKVVKVPAPDAPPPPTKEVPKETPKVEKAPVFGMTEEMVGESSIAVPTGQGTNMDPSKSGKHDGTVANVPPGKPGGEMKPEYKPVADIYIKTLPEIDGEACAKTVTYPQDAEQAGIEGEVKLRVWLDERGKVHDVKVLSGLGHGLDRAAEQALRYKCHFKPAVDTTGKPVAYVIQTYTWTFELPR